VNVFALKEKIDRIRAEIARAVIGQDELIEQTVIAVLARGHVLLEGAPGLGKTLLVRTLGIVLGCESKRIQFTPDLMPSDVTGGNVFNQQRGAFEFCPGRCSPSCCWPTRSTAPRQDPVGAAGGDAGAQRHHRRHDAPAAAPFFVIATQNPIESQGTYPLPEAQLDRFLFKIDVRHPTTASEKAILASHLAGFDASALDRMGLARVTTPEELLAMQTRSAACASTTACSNTSRTSSGARAATDLCISVRRRARRSRCSRGAGARGQRGT
jgi:MoxR-like ATPase